MNKLMGELVNAHVGPILVCGGAPCLPADLEILKAGGFDFENAVIVSGNEHAVHAGLQPTYIAANDDVHTVLKQHQEPRLRKLAPNAKLLSRHWWADYRHPKLLKANSGLTAALWASVMGASPLIMAGFEMYRGEKSYFHSEWQTESPSMARPDMFMRRQIKELKELLGDTPVRALSGLFTQEWPRWSPDEKFPERPLTPLQQRLVDELPRGKVLCAANCDVSWENALIPKGMVFAVTEAEAKRNLLFEGLLDVTNTAPDEARLAQVEKARSEHSRILVMIAKVRTHPRSVRRGIYDSDLARLIRWTEEGKTPLWIEKRTGLPKLQVEFLVKTMGVARGT